MHAEGLARFRHHAEPLVADHEAIAALARECEPGNRKIGRLLGFLMDPNRNKQKFVTACEAVHMDLSTPAFWRALAAHEQAAVTDSPDKYFALAASLILPARYDANKDTTPEGEYMYHRRMFDREAVVSFRHDLGMAMLGAETAIKHGWFEATAWTAAVSARLTEAGQSGKSRQLIHAFAERAQAPACYFARGQNSGFGELIAA